MVTKAYPVSINAFTPYRRQAFVGSTNCYCIMAFPQGQKIPHGYLAFKRCS